MANTDGHGPRTCVLYARVSTDEQAKHGYSVGPQLRRLQEWAEREGFEVVGAFKDEGWSGGYLERPGMTRVREIVRRGGVSFVVAEERDRFSREPVHLLMLADEFKEHGTRLRTPKAMDDSAEGEMFGGVQDSLARYIRRKMAEKSTEAKIEKAMKGEIVAGHTATYGFRFTEDRKGYEVDEEHMPVVHRIFEMVADGSPIHTVKRTLEKDGVPTPPTPRKNKHPEEAREWSKRTIRDVILDDAYRPHAFEEVAALMTPEEAARLDPERNYGLWYYNRRRTTFTPYIEHGPDGPKHRKRQHTVEKPREEWIAVPVPDAGIPREIVDAARDGIKDNRATVKTQDHVYELSGGVLYCGACGKRMAANRVVQRPSMKAMHYYRCPTRQNKGKDACPDARHHRADATEHEVWRFVRGLMLEPERLRRVFDRHIAEERDRLSGDPETKARRLSESLLSLDQRRTAFQDQQADGLMTRDELRQRLANIAETRATLKRELAAARNRRERVEELERSRDHMFAAWCWRNPADLDSKTPDERRDLYRRLRLRLETQPDGSLLATGIFGKRAVEAPTGHRLPVLRSERFGLTAIPMGDTNENFVYDAPWRR